MTRNSFQRSHDREPNNRNRGVADELKLLNLSSESIRAIMVLHPRERRELLNKLQSMKLWRDSFSIKAYRINSKKPRITVDAEVDPTYRGLSISLS